MRLITIFIVLALLIGGAMGAQTKIRPDQINTSMGWGVKLTNVTNGTAAQDVVTYSQLQAISSTGTPGAAWNWKVYSDGSTVKVYAENNSIIYSASSPTYDYAAVNVALNNVTATKNKVLLASAFTISGHTVNITKDYTEVYGGIITIAGTNAGVGIGWQANAISYLKLDGVRIVTSGTISDRYILDVCDAASLFIDHCHIENSVGAHRKGVRFTTTSALGQKAFWNYLTDSEIIGSTLFYHITDSGILNTFFNGYYVDNTDSLKIDGCANIKMTASHSTSPESGVQNLQALYIKDSSNTMISNCEIDGGLGGISGNGTFIDNSPMTQMIGGNTYETYMAGISIHNSARCAISNWNFIDCNKGNVYANDIMLYGSGTTNTTISFTTHIQQVSHSYKGQWVLEYNSGGMPSYTYLIYPQGTVTNYSGKYTISGTGSIVKVT